MKRYLLVAALAATFLWTASGQETTISISILNPQFNADELPCTPSANCYNIGITGWLIGPGTSVFKASTTQYPEAPAGGLYVAAIGGTVGTGSILQTLGATLQANTVYKLSLSVGARADLPFTGYAAALLAGNVTLAAGNKATPVAGTFLTEVVVYESGANPAQLGQPLQVLTKLGYPFHSGDPYSLWPAFGSIGIAFDH